MCVWDTIFLMKQPESLQEAIVYFVDPERAFRYAVQLRWPDARSTALAVVPKSTRL